MLLRVAVAATSVWVLPFALAADDRFMAPLPDPTAIEVKRDLAYRKAGNASLAFDLYLPAKRTGPAPVVVFVNGIGADWIRGHVQYTSWARAVTARGLTGVTMDFLTATLGDSLAHSIVAGQPLASASAAVYREDWPAAVTAYEGLVKTRAQDSLLWQRLGEARRARGDAPGALEAFAKALALGSPNHGIVSFAAATLQAQAGDVEKALASLQGMKPQLRFFADQLRTDPVFEALRKDPRVTALLKDVPPPPR